MTNRSNVIQHFYSRLRTFGGHILQNEHNNFNNQHGHINFIIVKRGIFENAGNFDSAGSATYLTKSQTLCYSVKENECESKEYQCDTASRSCFRGNR